MSHPKCGRTWLSFMVKGATGISLAARHPVKHHVEGHTYYNEIILLDFEEYFLLIRHPFDTAISNWYYRTYAQKSETKSLSLYLKKEVPGLLILYQNFYKNKHRFLDWIRYEDMVVDPERALKSYMRFLNVEGDIKAGLEAGDWEIMRKTEEKRGVPIENKRKFRRGRIGSYLELPEEDIIFMRQELEKFDPKEVWGYV